MKVQTNFAVPLAEVRHPDPQPLCEQLTGLFLDCEQKPDEFKNRNKRSTQHGLFESRFDLFSWEQPAVVELARFCHAAVQNLVATLSGYQPQEMSGLSFQYQSWFHVTRKNGFQGLHNHQNASWSGIFCVDPGELSEEHPESGAVRFHDPRNCAFMFLDDANRNLKSPFNHGAAQIRHEAGKLLVFPSYLTHEIFPYQGEQPRIVVAFNCWAHFKTPR